MKTLRNKVQLIGNLGMNPEIVRLENGRKLAKFSLATSTYHKNKSGERTKNTQWHNIIAWGASADVIEKYLTKGSQIALEGRLQYRTYETKDGIKRYATEVQLSDLTMLKLKEN